MGVCFNCDEDKQIWPFHHDDEETSIAEQVKKWRDHVKHASHDPSTDVEVIYIEYQDGATNVQYSLRYDYGKFIVDKVQNAKLGLLEGDVLVNFNDNDVRRKGPTFVKDKTDKINKATICKATFLRPPFPLDLLDRGKKVRFLQQNILKNESTEIKVLIEVPKSLLVVPRFP